MEYWEMVSKLKVLGGQGYTLYQKWNLWDSYSYETVGTVIYLTIKKEYKEGVLFSERALNWVFSTLAKKVNIEVIDAPYTDQLSYEDSLEWLFLHYKYWVDYNSNVVLLNSSNRILGIQYNNCKKTRTIVSADALVVPGYVVLNNSKKLEGVYFYKDYKTLEPGLANFFGGTN